MFHPLVGPADGGQSNDMPERTGIKGFLSKFAGGANDAEMAELDAKLGGDYSPENIQRVWKGGGLNAQQEAAAGDMWAKAQWYAQEEDIAQEAVDAGMAKPRSERSVSDLLAGDTSPMHIQALLRSGDLTDAQRTELRRMLPERPARVDAVTAALELAASVRAEEERARVEAALDVAASITGKVG